MRSLLLFMSAISLIACSSSVCAQKTSESEVKVEMNEDGTKSWLVNSRGKRISKKYAVVEYLYSGYPLKTDPPVYFQFSKRRHGDSPRGILTNEGKVLFPDTIQGYLSLLNEERFCADNEEKFTVYTFDGKLDDAYNQDLFYFEDGAMIKRKNGLFAVFSVYNVQFSKYIYSEFDTGRFLNRTPPVLVYMTKPDGEVDKIGPDGKLILE
ncbi:MAG: hypothetical protein AB8B56_21385 [Crocinitomicaceae bacterium]